MINQQPVTNKNTKRILLIYSECLRTLRYDNKSFYPHWNLQHNKQIVRASVYNEKVRNCCSYQQFDCSCCYRQILVWRIALVFFLLPPTNLNFDAYQYVSLLQEKCLITTGEGGFITVWHCEESPQEELEPSKHTKRKLHISGHRTKPY